MATYMHPTDHQYLPDQTLAGLRLGLSTSGIHYPVKQESRTPSPDSADCRQFQFNFQPSRGLPQFQSNAAHRPIHRFGSSSPLVSSNSWPSSSTSSIGHFHPDLMSMQNTVSFEDFDDTDELSELPSGPGLPGRSGGSMSQEKTIRRRSSKGVLNSPDSWNTKRHDIFYSLRPMP